MPVPTTDGQSLLLLDRYNDVLSLDPGSGRLTCLRAAADGLPPWVSGGSLISISRVGDGTQMLQSDGWFGDAWLLPDAAELPVRAIAHGAIYPAGDGMLWVGATDSAEQADHWTFELWAIDGLAPVRTVPLPAGAMPQRSDGLGGVLVGATDSTLLLTPDGELRKVWDGPRLTAVGPNHLAGLGSDSQGNPVLAVLDRASGTTATAGAASDAVLRADSNGEISADGKLMALTTWPPGEGAQREGLLVNLGDGSVRVLEGGVGPWSADPFTWSADGSRLWWVDHDGALRMWAPSGPATGLVVGAGELPPLVDIKIIAAQDG